MTAGLWELQKGLLEKLVASAELQLLIGTPPRIYDVPPPDPDFPLIMIGDMTPQEWGTRDYRGYEVLITLRAVADANRGSGEVKRINDVLRDVLDRQDITLEDGLVVQCLYERNEPEVLGEDGLLWLGGIVFKIYLQLEEE